jgi:fructoselysine-6-P-deglycase FrlB-like protein
MTDNERTTRAAAAEDRRDLLSADGPDEMGRELAGGPAAVEATLSGLARRREALATLIDEARRVQVLGTGASLAVSRCAEPLLRASDRGAGRTRPLLVREASGAVMGLPGDEMFRPDDCVIAVSKSGVSPEIVGASRRALAVGAHVVAVTSGDTSLLAKLAHEVVLVPIGDEHGASTKSALGALAALLAMWDLVERGEPGSQSLVRGLESVVRDWEPAWTIGRELAAARRIWFAGFGAAFGAAEAVSLLWHEKVGRPGVHTTPSGFRHGLIEAAGSEDAILLFEIDPPSPVRDEYMRLLSGECLRIGVEQVWISHERPPAGSWLTLLADEAAGRALEAFIRLPQLARGAAHAAGTYRDGFSILGSVVRTSTPFE